MSTLATRAPDLLRRAGRRPLIVGLAGLALTLATIVATAVLTAPAERSISIPIEDAPSSLERAASAAAVATLLIAAISAIYLAVQLHSIARGFRVQMFDSTSSRMLDLTRLCVEHPELRPVLYDGKRPSPADLPKAQAAAEAWLDYFSTELLRRREFPEAVAGLPDFRPWIVDSFRSSPVMRETFESHQAWYEDELTCLFHRAVQRPNAAGDEAMVFLAGPEVTGVGSGVEPPRSACPGDLLVLESSQTLLCRDYRREVDGVGRADTVEVAVKWSHAVDETSGRRPESNGGWLALEPSAARAVWDQALEGRGTARRINELEVRPPRRSV